MNIYRNKITGSIVVIPSEFGNTEVWEKISPAPVVDKVKAEPKEEKTVPKKSVIRKAVKK